MIKKIFDANIVIIIVLVLLMLMELFLLLSAAHSTPHPVPQPTFTTKPSISAEDALPEKYRNMNYNGPEK